MVTLFIAWSLAAMAGSAFTNRKVFKEFLSVRRHVEFRRQFPDHLTVRMQDDEYVAGIYAEKKRKARVAFQSIGLAAIWPLTFPLAVGNVVFDRLKDANTNMAPKITIDHYKIREEEGR